MEAKPGKTGGPRGRWWKSRRGVAAVLAMMFLILFGSLSVAMAIASKGNLTTSATYLHVSRAQSAAETGLAIAQRRLGLEQVAGDLRTDHAHRPSAVHFLRAQEPSLNHGRAAGELKLFGRADDRHPAGVAIFVFDRPPRIHKRRNRPRPPRVAATTARSR